MKLLILLFAASFALVHTALAQTFILDSTFSADGKVTTDHLNNQDFARTVALQSDGKIIVAGKSNLDFILMRYTSDGLLDSTFDADGIVNTDISNSGDEGKSLAVQPDGKILLGGITTKNGNANFSLARYHSNGSLDSTFSGDGKLFTPIGNGNDEGKAIVLQPDGKIILIGQSENGSHNDFALVRYDSFGNPDSSFGGDGIVTSDFGGPDEEGNCVRLQSDGKIVVAGYSGDTINQDLAVARYNTNGSLDSTFGLLGRRIVAVDSGKDIAFTMAIQADGKILAAGITDNGTDNDMVVIRLDSTGDVDATFDGDGIQTVAIGTLDDLCQTMALQADGKIILGGTSHNGANKDFAFVRLDGFGKVDSTLDADGRLTTDFANTPDDGFSMLIQPQDGKIVICGEVENATRDFGVARYTSSILTDIDRPALVEPFSVLFYPHPFRQSTTVRMTKPSKEAILLTMMNNFGQVVFTQNLIQPETALTPDLPQGIYYYSLRNGHRSVLATGRIVVQ